MFLDNYYYYFQKALTPEFCDKIIETGKSKIVEKAKILDESLKARNSSIAWMEEESIQVQKRHSSRTYDLF